MFGLGFGRTRTRMYSAWLRTLYPSAEENRASTVGSFIINLPTNIAINYYLLSIIYYLLFIHYFNSEHRL